MSITSTAPAEAPRTETVRPTRMLVCASEPGQGEPHVSLADGMYETIRERVFWRDTPDREVLRVPLDLPVVTRDLTDFPQQRSATGMGGEQSLIRAIQGSRSGPAHPEDVSEPAGLDVALMQALQAGDPELATAHAVLRWKQAGLIATYGAMSKLLATLADSWAAGTGTVFAEHRATRTVCQVADRLAALTPPPVRCGTVILAVPAGERHTLALTVLAHLIRDAGHSVQAVDDLPLAELGSLAADPGTLAVLVSIHTPRSVAEVRATMTALREAAPEVFLGLGGPGVPRTAATLGADVVTDDVAEFLHRLDACSSALTGREAEVLLAVADGRTNAEIAQLLHVSLATVKSHLDNIFTKTQTEHRAAAVARALRRGWIS